MTKNNQEPVKTYAQIIDSKVANVSLWSSDPIGIEEELVEIPVGSSAGIGWDYKDGKFEDNRPPIEIPSN
jgi:hypothetical protein